jgi:hypothetical protein
MRVMNRVRLVITVFVLVLLSVVTQGLIWSSTHQPPPLRTASQMVLAASAFAGVFALVRLWRPERRGGQRRS